MNVLNVFFSQKWRFVHGIVTLLAAYGVQLTEKVMEMREELIAALSWARLEFVFSPSSTHGV